MAEDNAIKRAFGDHADDLAVTATKSMTGHLLGAAGALEAVATILAVLRPARCRRRSTSTTRIPRSTLDVVTGEHRTLPDGDIAALNNSFGFGGHNVALAFRSI